MAITILDQARGNDLTYNKATTLFMAATRKPILYVEGDPDKTVIMLLFDEFTEDQIIIGGNKKGVKECLKKAINESHGKKLLYRGLVDRDLDTFHAAEKYIYEDCLFYTDERDMEALLWSTDESMFRSFLLMGGITYRDDKYKLVQMHDYYFNKIKEAAYQLGIIRLIAEDQTYKSIGIKVNQATDRIGRPLKGAPSPYDFYDAIMMSIDIPRLIDEYLCVTESQKSVRYDIEDAYDEKKKKYVDKKWKIIRGHDLNNMLFKTVNSQRSAKEQWDFRAFENELRKHYQHDKIFKCQLGISIRDWIISFRQATA